MKIFITGGSGFIGRNLKEQMSHIYEIFAPTSKELNLLNEKSVYEYVSMNNFDIIIHAATWNATRTSNKDTSLVLENNLKMFFNIAKCEKIVKKIINYGSGAEFNLNYWMPKMKEDFFNTFIPIDQYGFSKYIINNYIEKSDKIYNLRLFAVFGKYEDWKIRFISQTCCRALCDLPIVINQDINFDYMFIDDVVKVTDWFINNNPKEKIYNVCTGVVISLSELAKKILKISGKKLDIITLKEGMGSEYSGDNTKLINEIDNFSFKNIDECIRDLYNWYSVNSVDTRKI